MRGEAERSAMALARWIVQGCVLAALGASGLTGCDRDGTTPPPTPSTPPPKTPTPPPPAPTTPPKASFPFSLVR